MNKKIYTKKIFWPDGSISYYCDGINYLKYPFLPNFKITRKNYYNDISKFFFINIGSKLNWMNQIKNI